jgi:hypothetical protein
MDTDVNPVQHGAMRQRDARDGGYQKDMTKLHARLLNRRIFRGRISNGGQGIPVTLPTQARAGSASSAAGHRL